MTVGAHYAIAPTYLNCEPKEDHAGLHRHASRRECRTQLPQDGAVARNMRGTRFQERETYVQSGNVVFEAKGAPSQWHGKFERALAAEVRLPVSIIVARRPRCVTIIARNPFLKRKDIETAKLHVTFLAEAPGKSSARCADRDRGGQRRIPLVRKNVYVYCPNGYGRTKLSNNALEKALGVRATTRNWNTVKTLCAMADANSAASARIGQRQSGANPLRPAAKIAAAAASRRSGR